jgi:hypothetical protein
MHEMVVLDPLLTLHGVSPVGQAHRPETQTSPATVGVVQLAPHPPQLAESVIGLMHVAPHAISPVGHPHVLGAAPPQTPMVHAPH